MLSATVKNHLTIKTLVAMLCPLSQKTKVRIGLRNTGVKTPIKTLSVFLCQFISNTGKNRVLSSMVDCLGEALRSFTSTCAGRPTLFNPPPVIGLIGGGNSLINTGIQQ